MRFCMSAHGSFVPLRAISFFAPSGKHPLRGRAIRGHLPSTMLIDRDGEDPRLLDVLDRCLDRGIVIDAWLRVSVAGLEMMTVQARVVVASIETFLEHAEPLSGSRPLSVAVGSASRPRGRGSARPAH
jgi:hypothetical protein